MTQPDAKRYLRQFLIFGFALLALSASAVFAFTAATAGIRVAPVSPVVVHPQPDLSNQDVLRVMSLNLAHGRANGRKQLLQSTTAIRANLATIASLLGRESPHIVALQEADGPSFWSGRFDHVECLARDASYHSCARGANVNGLGLSYGSGLLSQLPLHDATAHAADLCQRLDAGHCPLARPRHRRRLTPSRLFARQQPLRASRRYYCRACST